MTATGTLPKPHRPWHAILLSGALAFAIAIAVQPLFVLALVQMRGHTDLDAVRGHIRQAFDHGVLAENSRPELFIHRGGHQFTECIGHVVLLDSQTDPARTAILPLVHDDYNSATPARNFEKPPTASRRPQRPIMHAIGTATASTYGRCSRPSASPRFG